MADNVTLLDLSFKTDEAVNGLDALIKKSLELAEKKAQLTKQINEEKAVLAELRKSYSGNAVDQTTFEKQTAKSEMAIISLTKQLNNNKVEISENSAAIKANTTIVNAEAESVETLRAKLALNTKELNKMSVEQRTNSEAGKQMVAQTKEISSKLKDLEKEIGDTRRNVGNYAEDIEKATGSLGGLTGATGQMVQGMSTGITQVKAFNAALMANPFIAIASAVLILIGHLEKLKSRNEELAVGIKTLFAPVQFLIAKITDAVASLLSAIVEGLNWMYDTQVNLLDALGVLPDGFKKAREEIKGVAQAQRDLYNAETDNILVMSKYKKELEQAKLLAADQTKSVAERKAALEKAIEISKQMEDAEVGLAKAKYEQVKLENGLSYTKDEERRKEVEHEAAMEDLKAQYASQRKEIESQLTGFTKSENDKRAAEEKTRADNYVKAQKAAAEKAKKAKEDAEKKAAETAKKVQAEVLKSYEDGLTTLRLKIRESNIGIVDKRKALEDQDRLNQAILEKERYRLQQGLITQKEFDNIKLEQQIAFREKVAELEKEEAEKKKEQKALSVEQERIIEQANITSNFEKLAMNLETARKLEIEAAEKSGADVTAIEEKYAKLREELRKKEVNAKLQMTAEVAGQISNLLGQESAAGKAFALAQATINTYLGASKAIAQGGIWGVAQAAIVIAAGLKQVASIMKVKEEVPKTNTSVKKFAKGGTVFGAPHSQGGVTFTGSNGQQFEAEGGENMYILNKRASHAINALSALNQQYGGRSFGNSNAYRYAQGGGFDVISTQSYTNLNRSMSKQTVDLSDKTVAAIALAFVEGVENAPNPIVSVQDITDVQQNRTIVIDSALG